MSSTHRHLLLDVFWQVISGPPCINHGGEVPYSLRALQPSARRGL
jgi:hypothetical protein